ncbi:unnamed protein product [Strongylus vulgaris]|uniref:Uncharacterized protein n=1 Tax=Strongylus vulgaris TaxID=40348 RepID=A0A3P7K1L0_STRVU|nr:unnamed protein product [Strongylus vulgaris]
MYFRDVTRRLAKRAFDRLEGNEFGLFKRVVDKRAFDRSLSLRIIRTFCFILSQFRLDYADFGLRRKREFDRIARAEFGLTGLRRKRSFDIAFDDYGLGDKRALDRIGGSEFGLIKRSVDHYSGRGMLLAHDCVIHI